MSPYLRKRRLGLKLVQPTPPHIQRLKWVVQFDEPVTKDPASVIPCIAQTGPVARLRIRILVFLGHGRLMMGYLPDI